MQAEAIMFQLTSQHRQNSFIIAHWINDVEWRNLLTPLVYRDTLQGASLLLWVLADDENMNAMA